MASRSAPPRTQGVFLSFESESECRPPRPDSLQSLTPRAPASGHDSSGLPAAHPSGPAGKPALASESCIGEPTLLEASSRRPRADPAGAHQLGACGTGGGWPPRLAQGGGSPTQARGQARQARPSRRSPTWPSLDAGPGSLTKTRVAARDRAQARVPGTDPLCDQSSRCEARHVCCAQRTLEPACVRIPFADAKGAQRPGAARPLAHQLHAGGSSGVGGTSYFSSCWSCMIATWF